MINANYYRAILNGQYIPYCLYILRRAYYSWSDDLEEFDFGKNHSIHAAHWFDYL
ncbi:hypothetical protein F4813DRAFT_377216, partial [Daldinia decipiens]|uniref:uncharacterized protein n=1 Tax=Daldinia decipiens TaxID=326647 RepID=UPI0020C321AF